MNHDILLLSDGEANCACVFICERSGVTVMRVVVTGGTGFLGRRLCAELIANGHVVCVMSREPKRVQAVCGEGVATISFKDPWPDAAEFDAVIHLAGASVFDQRWTPMRKRMLWESRVMFTRRLIQWASATAQHPAVFFSGSAIGIYGERGDDVLDEEALPSDDFLGRLCAAWEGAAQPGLEAGIRVCQLRTGLVLHRSGGMMQKMVPPFRCGVGCRFGQGQQWMSWIHLDDWVGLVIRLLEDSNAVGAFNLTAPEPVTHDTFTKTLGRLLNRPVWGPVPDTLLQWVLGERACLLSASQRAIPARAKALGYVFRYPELEAALRQVTAREERDVRG